MALVSHPNVELPLPSGSPATVRIEPQRNLFELRLYEVRQYRELLYFFMPCAFSVRAHPILQNSGER